MHGSSQFMQCTNPDCEADIWPAGELSVKFDTTTYRAQPPFPKCIKCDRLARPNVLMFGDYTWKDDRNVRQISEPYEALTACRPVKSCSGRSGAPR